MPTGFICKRPKEEKPGNNHRTASKATTTPLVRYIFESIFAEDGVLDDDAQRDSTTVSKVQVKKDLDETEDDDEEDEDEKFDKNTQHKRRRVLSKEEKRERALRKSGIKHFDAEWIGPSVGCKGKKDYYAGIRLNGKEYRVGDHVLINGT